jgi:hypothetical protein
LRKRRLFRVIASASETIHRAATRKNGLLRRYAPRNDFDRSEHDFLFSRRDAPGVLLETLPSEIRGRRENRMRAAPAVSRAMCIKECCTRAYRFSGEPPAFPAQWLYGLYDLVLVTGFLATIIGFSFRFRQLDASTGASDPNDFAVRSRRARQSQPSRPPLPAPTFVTMADAPLAGRDGGSCRVESTCPQRGIFSRQGLDQHLG